MLLSTGKKVCPVFLLAWRPNGFGYGETPWPGHIFGLPDVIDLFCPEIGLSAFNEFAVHPGRYGIELISLA
ncbi:hypothetical protein D9M68_994640 [compost metagenome]